VALEVDVLRMNVKRAEAAPEGLVGLDRQVLVAKEQDPVVQERAVNFGEGLVVEAIEVDPRHFGAASACNRLHDDSLVLACAVLDRRCRNGARLCQSGK